MPLVYRPALAQDLARADPLVVASINDLTERHGFGSMATIQFRTSALSRHGSISILRKPRSLLDPPASSWRRFHPSLLLGHRSSRMLRY